MLEIEIKARIENPEKFLEKIATCGARLRESAQESDQYFNHPFRDFAKSDEALRVRTTRTHAALTYKGPKIGTRSKSRFEAEVNISDPEAMKVILQKLGFTEVHCVIKNRDVYELKNITICVDRVENLGSFVELEKIGEDREKLENELFGLARELGLSEFERRSYLEMLLEKHNEIK